MSTITIRPARHDELDSIWALVQRAVDGMHRQGNPQWGEDYPTRSFYAGDLERGELFAAEAGGILAGVACINTAQAPEYAPMSWTTEDHAVVIHRMAVDPVFQGQGVGQALFAFAEAQARSQGVRAMRIDTYSLNHPMQALIQKMGFTPVGHIHLHGRPLVYPCFEKALL